MVHDSHDAAYAHGRGRVPREDEEAAPEVHPGRRHVAHQAADITLYIYIYIHIYIYIYYIL